MRSQHAEGAARAVRACRWCCGRCARRSRRAPGRVVVVDSPARALEAVLPDGRRAGGAGAPERHRRRGRARRMDALGATRRRPRTAPVVVLSGDVPLRQRRGDRASSCDAHARQRRGGDDGDARCSRTRAATGASCATPTARCERVVETKAQGDATQAELRDPRGQHGHLRLRRRGAAARRCRG